MKKPCFYYLFIINLFVSLNTSFAQRFWVATGPGPHNWNNTANWSTTSGGAGGASVPSTGDAVTFNAGSANNCTLDVAPTIAGITITGYTGIINLNGFTLTTTGTNMFTAGAINNTGGAASLALNTVNATTFNGTTFGANVTGSSGRLHFNGSTFNGSVNVTKTDSNNDIGTGNNIFNNTATFTNNGNGYLLFGNVNRDQFFGAATFNNTGQSFISVAHNHAGQTTTFAADVVLNSNKSGGTDPDSFFFAARNSSHIQFNGNLNINCAGSIRSNHNFLNGTGSTATYNRNVTVNLTNSHVGTEINLGTNGTSTYNGNIIVSNGGGAWGVRFNQNAASSSTLASGRSISLGGSFASGFLTLSRFNQDGATPQTLNLTGTSAMIIAGSEFDGDVTFAAPILLTQNTIYNGVTSLTKTGAGNSANNRNNTFNGTTTITHNGDGEWYFGDGGADTFNGSTTFNNTGSYRIRVAYSHAGQTTTFANNVTMNANKSGGADSWSFLSSELGSSHLTITGDLTINITGNLRSDVRFATGLGSIFTLNGNLIINNTNTDPNTLVTLGTNGTSNYNGNITLSNSGGAAGVTFNVNAIASATQAATGTFTTSGFTSGTLLIQRFTRSGTLPLTLNLTGTTTELRVGPSASFGGNVDLRAPQVYLQGITVGGTAYVEKTGATSNAGAGGNIFNGVTTITNSGTGYLMTGNSNSDQFNAATTFNLTGGGQIYFAHNHTGQTTTFASNVTMNANKTIGGNGWGYLVAEHANVGLSIGGTLTLNCGGTIQSNYHFLSGAGSTATFGGDVNINVTNTSASTAIVMGITGMSTYQGNINVANPAGVSPITFNEQPSASSTLAGSITNGTYSGGSLNLLRFTQTNNLATNTLNPTGSTLLYVGPNSSFAGDVNFVSPRLFLHGATYHGITYLEKTGSGNDNSNGGNTFNNTTTLVNSGSGHLVMANTTLDIFNDNLTITNTGSNAIYMAHNVAGNQFNDNITVNSSGSSLGIIFSGNATGSSTLTNSTIAVGASFSTGSLRLHRFTQVGLISQNINLTGSAELTIGPNSSFDGSVTATSPRLLLNGATYKEPVILQKTGAGTDTGDGGNTFVKDAEIINSGSAPLITGRISPDLFQSDVVIDNQGSSTVQLADGSFGNVFNGNIELNSSFGGGIYFCNFTALSSAILAAGRTITTGSVITGDIRLIRFTQLGSTPQALTLTGIGLLTLGPSSTFNGNVNFIAPQVLLNGTTFNGTAFIEKTGATNNHSTGGNVFNGATTLRHSGSDNFLTGNTSSDQFNAALTLTNVGSGILYLAHNTSGNQFNGNIVFNSTLGSQGIYFGENSGSSTLANGAVMSIGGSGFSSGDIRFRRFTQLGATTQNLTLTGTGRLMIGPLTTFNGPVNFAAPRISLEGATYQAATVLEKTGASDDNSAGGNTFNNTLTVRNSGTAFFRFANTSLDTFNGDVTLTNTGSSAIQMAYTASGTIFNGNIFVNSTFGGGVHFGENGGTSSIAPGRTISVGGTGFTLGDLRLRRFTQFHAAAPQTLLLTGTAALYIGPATSISGNANFRAPKLYMSGSTFQNTVHLEKTGATDNSSGGGMTFNGPTTIHNSGTGFLRTNGANIFNGTTTLSNSGSNYLMMEYTTGSLYNGDLTLTNTGSSTIRSSYEGNTTYNGNITINNTGAGANSGVRFGEQATASSTFAAGRTLSIGGLGFTGGSLQIQRLIQLGATPVTLTLTGTSTFSAGPNNFWGGNFTVSAPSVYLTYNTFNGLTNSFTKTGATLDPNLGGNVFMGSATFTSTGTGTMRIGVLYPDDFTRDVTFNQTSGLLLPAYSTASTFRGNVTTSGSAAVTFGSISGSAVFTGGNAQIVSKTGGSASPVFRRIEMNKSADAVTLNTDATVTANVTFTNGVINTTTTNYLNFADNATVTGGSNASHVDGPVRKTGNDAFTFPTGDNGIFRGIGISAPTNVAHYFTAEYFKAAHGLGGPSTYTPPILTVSPCEYWMLDRNPVVGGSNVSVTLSWVNTDCIAPYITDPNTLAVTRWDNTTSKWINHGNGGVTGTTASGTVVSNGVISSFSPFTIASTSMANPLPIELVDFTGEHMNGRVNLYWYTASEFNNAYFTIERSLEGFEFTPIGQVNGKGTVTTKTTYNFTDNDPFTGKSYYRLRQTDFDGSFSYSKVISVDEQDLAWNLYPNPVSYGTNVTLTRKGTYTVYNNMGAVVMTVTNGNSINIANLPAGVYIVRNAIGLSKRLVIQ